MFLNFFVCFVFLGLVVSFVVLFSVLNGVCLAHCSVVFVSTVLFSFCRLGLNGVFFFLNFTLGVHDLSVTHWSWLESDKGEGRIY